MTSLRALSSRYWSLGLFACIQAQCTQQTSLSSSSPNIRGGIQNAHALATKEPSHDTCALLLGIAMHCPVEHRQSTNAEDLSTLRHSHCGCLVKSGRMSGAYKKQEPQVAPTGFENDKNKLSGWLTCCLIWRMMKGR